MSTERSIPHLRDIFGLSINHKSQEPVYNHPPLNGEIDKPVKKSKKSSKSSSNGQQNGGGELKTLERHLSMKKTIRKKIMRDLQQAFVDDPNEFKVDNNHRTAELNLEAMRYGDTNKHRSRKSDNFLDMLRGDQNMQSTNAMNYHNSQLTAAHHNHQSPAPPPQSQPYRQQGGEENCPEIHQNVLPNNEKQSFWSRFGIRNKNKR